MLVYATVYPNGTTPTLEAICIDYTQYKDFDVWQAAGEPHSTEFPKEYRDLDYKPLTNQGDNPLNVNGTLADFRSIALAFHSEFFGEHPDNTIFVNLVKCLLAKIFDEKTTKQSHEYGFQVFQTNGKPETAKQVFKRVNGLYKKAYNRFVAPKPEDDEINTREFSEERVKTVVQALQRMSMTMGAARNGDIIGAFFEETLRAGFKQDRGMYFTHDNLARFMVEAVGLKNLTEKTWVSSNHPENRLPYIIDPACGSGTFLLHAMQHVTNTMRNSNSVLAADQESEEFFKIQMGDDRPNRWAERFIYGFDPKFVMAITAKVNMVLHGDGSAHILKEDAFSPFSKYSEIILRPCSSEIQRSVPRSRYRPDLCETFDLVISNPPFGVTLSSETRNSLGNTFSLRDTTPSEGLFIERCFQLLKPGGRLAVVVPESLLNGKEMMDVRIFMYRMFTIKSVVSMPRNLFIDTPTKTSILIAQKKMPCDIEEWDKRWQTAGQTFDQCVAQARQALYKGFCKNHTASEVATTFKNAISPVVSGNSWVVKGGNDPRLLRFSVDWTDEPSANAASYYSNILKTSDFRRIRDQYCFMSVANDYSYEFPVYEVEEVGYKLSARGERQRPNQLLRMKGRTTNQNINNLHLAKEECDVVIDLRNPVTVLDEIMAEVSWP